MSGGASAIEPWCVQVTSDRRARDTTNPCNPGSFCESWNEDWYSLPRRQTIAGSSTLENVLSAYKDSSVQGRVRNLQVACRTSIREEGVI